MMTTVFLCLGSNIKPECNIRFAVQRFKEEFDDVRMSNLYQSRALGFDGEDFLNLALSFKTDLTLEQLLAYTDALEQEAGRVRVCRGNFDSRTLDVDLVMYGDLAGVHKGRQWPSEDIQDSAHVLLPMSEIAGDHKHPTLGVGFAELWKEFDSASQLLKRVKRTW